MKPLCALILFAMIPLQLFPQETPRIRGFLAKDISEEQSLEKQAQSVPDTARFRKYMDFMSGEPHNAGSPRSKVVAEYILGSFKEWGLDARIEEFEALLPTPTLRQVEVLSPKH